MVCKLIFLVIKYNSSSVDNLKIVPIPFPQPVSSVPRDPRFIVNYWSVLLELCDTLPGIGTLKEFANLLTRELFPVLGLPTIAI